MATQAERLEALLTEQEELIRRRFEAFIREMNSEDVLAVIADLLEAGSVGEALEIVDSFIERFADVLPEVQQAVGAATAAELGSMVGDIALAVGFDPTHPRAAALARAARLSLVRELLPEQRKAIRQALGRSFDAGTGTFSTARSFRNAIGLTSGQEAWVASFEARLRGLDARALAMQLRDRRFDRTIQRAIRMGRPLSEAQIENMVNRYRLRALMYRSENIARTEALRVTSQARDEALRQMIEQTRIDPARVERIWNSTADARVRDAHRSMNGDRVGLDDLFTDGDGNRLRWPGDPNAPAQTTINCRCSVTYEILPRPTA
jgi:Phage Mu protein F like protein